MSEENEPHNEEEENLPQGENNNENDDNIIPLSGMYKDWFLDYASYVILERAVPALLDGFKPVQRRIMHSMKEMDDGRYNKVANVIGNTMKYHPHGDASIGEAMVQMGQKDLLIDTQGNWGNILTGDSAAAPRYIEARLSKFASHVVFNAKTTEWLPSYDGRNKEPVHLPVKFPLLLAQGAEGIAVGMACKVMPHNFIELIDASIDVLRGKKTNILPDFPQGGLADFSNYNEGERGGKIRVRARIEKVDTKTLIITEVPFGSTTGSLIESVIKANEKGKIKIKKIEDNTAAEVEIMIHLGTGVSPDKTIDALYAFTNCEMSISPNTSVIHENKPMFLSVNEILKISTNQTVELLKLELEIRRGELEEQWHFASLEKIFIEQKIYIEFDGKTYEEAIEVTHELLKPHVKHLKREVTDDDVKRLLEIKMRRITKHDSDKADTFIESLEEELKQIAFHLDNLIEFAIDYFKDLKKKFGEGKERKTEIRHFDNIAVQKVVVANKKLYVDREEGFVGWGLKKAEFVKECSDLDDVIIFFKTGKMMVTKIADKKFVGKGIIHCTVWKKGDERTIYHLIYRDGGEGGPTMMKRFAVKSITRDKEYDLTRGTKGSKVYYFSYHPNGEREVVQVQLRPRPHLKRVKYDIDFGELIIKGRSAAGNRVTKEIVSKVIQKEVGESTLAARKIWWDDVVKRLNVDGRGEFLGRFKGDDKLLTIYDTGELRVTNFDLSNRFSDNLVHIEKWHPERPISAIYYDAEKDLHFVKRFLVEVKSDKKTSFIAEFEGSTLDVVSTAYKPVARVVYNKRLKETRDKEDELINLDEFIDIKGMKAQGNQLTKLKIKEILLEGPIKGDEPWPEVEVEEEDQLEDGMEDGEDFDDSDEDTQSSISDDDTEDEDSESPIEIEWDLEEEKETKKPKKNNPIKDSDEDDDSQTSLF
ncbi:DNA gyrase/topoisomerase IV subunit A [Paracrocinitomix mangrovi]|uniref:DNA gyrase/topoisomerase IV subunit A n=1 Tax=Paracrocinitomix mangrovi TaxID=2862509 RepID=UPI001C8D82BF|nr:DNA gyrase/topoisomerase IV subunit A [Paracrocinitomix mangrovi]UKN02287.1 DNA gyrase/topoisomerase IV subunit A [Paracrocinitomix mangrovi]